MLIFLDLQSEDDIIYQDIMKDGGLKARALYDYQAGKNALTLIPIQTKKISLYFQPMSLRLRSIRVI